MANLGELLAELRHDRGLKQEELADILHQKHNLKL